MYVVILLLLKIIIKLYFFPQNTTEDANVGDKKFVACIPSVSPRGHTGYLTTATYVTGTAVQQQQVEEETDNENACEN